MSEMGTGSRELRPADCPLPAPPKCKCLKGFLQFLFVALVMAFHSLSAQNPFIQHYTTSDGLPFNYIYKIFQDSKKFLWFATGDGLVRYDGSVFTKYEKKDGLTLYFVSNILGEDLFGRIWLYDGSVGKLNFIFHNRIFNESNASFLDSLKGFDQFFQDNDHIIYFFQWESRKIYALDTNNRIKKYDLPSIPVDMGGEMYEGMNVKALTKSLKGEFLIWTYIGCYKTRNLNEKPTLLYSYDFGYKIIFSGNQTVYEIIHDYKTHKNIYVKYFHENRLDLTELISKSPFLAFEARCVLEDSNGIFWICTYDDVICLKNEQIIYQFDIKGSNNIMQDHENNIWISSPNGAYKISPYFRYPKNYDNSFFHNEGIEKLSPNSKDGVWCTNREMTCLLKCNEFYTLDYNSKPHLHFVKPSNSYHLIYPLKNNSLIIADSWTYDTYNFTGIKTDHLNMKVYFNNIFRLPLILKIRFNNDGSRFSAKSHPGENVITTFSTDNQIKEISKLDIGEFIGNYFYDASNNLIVNTTKNNYIIRNDKKLPCKELFRFNGKVIRYHLILNNSSELYYTTEDSIYMMNKNKVLNVTSSIGFPTDLHIQILRYNKPTLYLSTFRNIYKIDNPLNILEKKPMQLQLIDINFRNIHDILVYKDSLYVASDDGLTVIPKAIIDKIKSQTPLPYFISVQVNDKDTDPSRLEITLTGNNKIKFGFGAINYSSALVFFSYKLQGFDNNWTTGTTHEIVYSNLPRGNYVFTVRANKPGAPMSRPLEYRITIKAHFWQHPLFFVFLSLLFTGLIALIIIRRKNIQIKRSELDNQLITLEQKALQSMMNPHFIFNSLGSIQNFLLEKKSSEAGLYLSQFARLIRQNLNAINATSISLEEEIDRLKNYLDLEKLRMEDKFDYRIEIAENVDTNEIQIPSMIIQPFVENAIWHGIAFLKEKGQLMIRFIMKNAKTLNVIVEDNGIGIKRSEVFFANQEKRQHLGMELARKRLEILGKKFSVKTSLDYSELFPDNQNTGTRVEIVVPVYSD